MVIRGDCYLVGWLESIVVSFTAWYAFWGITVERNVVEDSSFWASYEGWVDTLAAHVEISAVIKFGISTMVQFMTVRGQLGGIGWARETIIQDLEFLGTASSSDTGVFPLAATGEFIENKTFVARPLYWNSSGTFVVVGAV